MASSLGHKAVEDFNDNVRLDSSQVSDQRRRRVPRLTLGGGGLGIVGLILALVLGVQPE
ncbi:MAG: hypothetical protein JWO27_772 [Frankiales bacterium]|jgi:hypothetical protein|nr:hypothetical protein [Frankiales bacterium]MCW2708207.1 hypothetical protein [Frankiales bacterium]